MTKLSLLVVSAIAAIAGLASAECDATNTASGSTITITDGAVCLPQGAGSYTFVMTTGLYATGLPGTSATPTSGYFGILDNTCKILGWYAQPGCGIPYTIKDNFLQDVLTVDTVSFDVGSPFFAFTYGNGKFSIGNNGCVCGETQQSTAIDVEKACRCAFPVSGVVAKREVEFAA